MRHQFLQRTDDRIGGLARVRRIPIGPYFTFHPRQGTTGGAKSVEIGCSSTLGVVVISLPSSLIAHDLRVLSRIQLRNCPTYRFMIARGLRFGASGRREITCKRPVPHCLIFFGNSAIPNQSINTRKMCQSQAHNVQENQGRTRCEHAFRPIQRSIHIHTVPLRHITAKGSIRTEPKKIYIND